MREFCTKKMTGTTETECTERERKHAALARRAAAEGMVLLKNENGLLPFARDRKLALYGSGAYRTIKGGTGSGDVNERYSVSIYEGLKNAGYPIANESWMQTYAETYDSAREAWIEMIRNGQEENGSVDKFFAFYCSHPFEVPAGETPREADCDTAVYVLSRVAGEGADRYAKGGDYYLTGQEEEMLAAICRLYPHVLLIVNTGGVVDLSFLDTYAQIEGVLQIVQPGMEGGNAVADVLSGVVTPSGKLTDTWAYHYEDYPSSAEFSHNDGDVTNERYTEGIYVGYRYFDTFEVPVRYGFGYGLSYASFSVEAEGLAVREGGRTIAVTARVSNQSGKFSGREVVQIYVSAPDDGQRKEFRRLAAFGKTGILAPGESERMTVSFRAEQLASYCESRSAWVLDKGEYVIWAGNSLESSEPVGTLRLEEEIILEKTQPICPVETEYAEPLKKAEEELRGRVSTKSRYEAALESARRGVCGVVEWQPDEAMRRGREISYRGNRMSECEEAAAITGALSQEQWISMATGSLGKGQGGSLGAAGESVPGSAAETSSCALEQGVAAITLADGPAGLRLMRYYDVEQGRVVQKPFHFSLEGGVLFKDTGAVYEARYYQYCTAIPVGTLLAQTFDTELLREVGRMIGEEMQEFRVALWLAPGMNIHRNPLCGRNFEYYSEDPLVSGIMAAAMTQGVQSDAGVGTTIKHFACNSQEDNRKGSNSIVSERALREIYLKGFEIAVKSSQPMAIMTSYNEVNGVHAANSYDLCTKAARDEWGFAGVIMTDWTTTEDGPQCTAAGCMRAGNDLVMPGKDTDHENLRRELAEGTLSQEDLAACVSRSVAIILQTNAYQDAQPYADNFSDLPEYVSVTRE